MGPLEVRRFKTSDGLTIVGDEGGRAQGRRPVILLHGGGQTRHSWATAMRKLLDHGYHVINLDARGHGDSEWSPSGDYGLASLAGDLRVVIDTLPEAPVLVGASMGGMTALHAVGNSSTPLAAALVLVDIVPRPNADGVARIREFMQSSSDGFDSLTEVVSAVAAYNPHRLQQGNVNGLMKNLRLGEDGRLRWHWDSAILRDPTLADHLELTASLLDACDRIQIPTLLIRGARSDVVDENGMDEFRKHLPHLQTANVSGAGHMVAGDSNDLFIEAVTTFIEAQMPPRIQ